LTFDGFFLNVPYPSFQLQAYVQKRLGSPEPVAEFSQIFGFLTKDAAKLLHLPRLSQERCRADIHH